MEFDGGAAAVGGVIAGLAMLAPRLALRVAGARPRMDVAVMWSTMFRVQGTAGRLFGWGMHLLVSVVIGFVYAWGFRYLFGATDALWLWGLVGGAIHYVIAGVFLVIAPETNSQIPQRVPAPGAFAAKLGGVDVAAFLIGHLAYGVTFGIVYAVLHRAGGAGSAF